MEFFKALKIVFKEKKYQKTFILVSLAIFGLLVYIPAKMIPGNGLLSQIGLMQRSDIILYLSLAIITAISITFNLYLLSRKAGGIKYGVFAVGQTGVGLISAVFASIFGVATCAACLTALIGLIGVGGVFFLVDYRTPITLAAMAILLISLYFTSQKVLGTCKTCKW